MRVLLTSVAAAMMLVAIGAVGSRVEAAMMQGIGTLPLQTKSHSGIEKVGYYRRHARRAYRRGYYGYGYMDTAIGHMVTTAMAGATSTPSRRRPERPSQSRSRPSSTT